MLTLLPMVMLKVISITALMHVAVFSLPERQAPIAVVCVSLSELSKRPATESFLNRLIQITFELCWVLHSVIGILSCSITSLDLSFKRLRHMVQIQNQFIWPDHLH